MLSISSSSSYISVDTMTRPCLPAAINFPPSLSCKPSAFFLGSFCIPSCVHPAFPLRPQRLPKTCWRRVHFLFFPLFLLAAQNLYRALQSFYIPACNLPAFPLGLASVVCLYQSASVIMLEKLHVLLLLLTAGCRLLSRLPLLGAGCSS